jgi:hypothetical protein
MVIGWEVLELTKVNKKVKLGKINPSFFISCDPQGFRPALKKKKAILLK